MMYVCMYVGYEMLYDVRMYVGYEMLIHMDGPNHRHAVINVVCLLASSHPQESTNVR